LEHHKLESKEELSHKEYRRDAYKLLADCYHLPDEGLIENLSALDTKMGGIFSDLANFCPGISDISSLAIDYSKLFVGPYGLLASPYGSIYLEDKGQIMGNSTIDVEKRYAEAGLDIGLKEAPDHIAIELEFMYFLVFQEIAAFNNNDINSMTRYQSTQKTFLETHLGVWVSDFTNKVTENTEAVFYENLARLTNFFVTEDFKYLCDTPLLAIQDTLIA
jgi:TorA maturation chaperone TorD